MSYKVTFTGRNICPKRSQKGVVLLMLVFMMVIVFTVLTYKYLNGASGQLNQQERTAEALVDAKAAVIAYALVNNSGMLPCPEDVSKVGTLQEGTELLTCNTDALRIGRLPWKSLGVGRLLDGDDEPLWYAVSSGFRSAPINSETLPQLSLNGAANSAIAIIFSAGSALPGQSRVAVSSATPLIQSNYLDIGNADPDTTFFKAPASNTFNDQLITISHADIFVPLEKRVLGEIKKSTSIYKDTWHAYPFPVSFTNPAALGSNAFVGDISESGGLLPVSDSVTTNLSLANIVISPVLGSASNQTCSIVNPGNNTNERIECSAQLSPLFNFFYATGYVQYGFSNVGKAFVGSTPLTTADFQTSSISPTYTVGLTSVTQQIDAAANGIVRVPFTIFNNFTSTATTTIRISINITKYPAEDAWTAASSWLIQNNWHRLVYYRIATPFKPAGNLATPICSGNCLSVRSTYREGTPQISPDIPGILMMAGKALNSTDFQATPAQLRPSDQLKEYFDTTNNVAAETTLTFDQILPLKSTYNDQLQTLSP